jgi:membrane-bound lytic murein transglycosylase A
MARYRCRILFGVLLSLTAGASAAAADKVLRFPGAQIETLQFSALNGWTADDQAAAFGSFLKSCKAIRGGTAAMRAARPMFGALHDVCGRASELAGKHDSAQARAFFEKNFKPVRITPAGEPGGFFTGYYETVIEGSRKRTSEFSVPLYRSPQNVSAYDRTQIEEGALNGKGLELVWLKNPVDAFFAQIQGSARVKLAGGETMRVGYAARNGLPYTPVGKFLIDRGIVSKEDMSMDKIRAFMESNPDEGRDLRRKNRSYVFFREMPLDKDAHSTGGQGIELTPYRSLAVDRSLHVYGTPIWIEAELPLESDKPVTPFRKLAIAQDTGSAIIGPARADIFFGAGEDIGKVAGRIKQFGKFVVLVPNGVTVTGAPGPDAGAAATPKAMSPKP